MNAINLASITISFLRKNIIQKDRTAWVKWREIVQSIHSGNIDKTEVKHLINVGVGQARKIKTTEALVGKLKTASAEELKETQQYVALFLELEKQAKDAIVFQKHYNKFETISADLGLGKLDTLNQVIEEWIEKFQEDRFVLKIKIPGTVQIILLDYILRWILLGLYNQKGFKGHDYFGDEEGTFIVFNALVIPAFVIAYAFLRDKYINRKSTHLFKEINQNNLQLRTHHSPWNYLLGFLFILSGSIIPVVAFEGESEEGIWLAELSLGIVYAIYILVLLKHFSKTRPSVSQVYKQLEELNFKQVKSDLSAEENDEEIVELEVNLRSANEKMDAYVLEAALFGALAFSAFLQVVASEVLLLENIGLFSDQAFAFFKQIVLFDLSGSDQILGYILSKEGLLSLMAYETLFCSVFFLAVIASRLKFNDLTDSIDRFLNLSKTYNEKEESIIAEGKNSNVASSITKKIRGFLSKGNLTLEETKPIMEYMRFFRTLGISSFFAIIVTGGLFISVKLSFVLLFISVLSLLFFKLDAIVQSIKNFSTRIQEYYFTVGKTFHLICWGLVVLALIFRSFEVNVLIGGNILAFIAFALLFIHYIISLFVPEQLEGLNVENDVFGSATSLQIFGKKILKISLAFFFLGYMFKIQHWPGAGFLLILGSFSMIFHFLLSKKMRAGSKRAISVLISVSLAFAIGGIIFRIQHWPGSGLMRWLALVGIIISAILGWKYKSDVLPSTKRAVVILFAVGILAQVPFFNWSMSRLSFNYPHYKLALDYDKHFDNIAFTKKEFGGYADAKNKNDLDSLRYYCKSFTQKHLVSPRTNWNELYWLANNLSIKTNDKVALEEAQIWIEKSIELEEMHINVDTYAYILFKLKKYDEAEVQVKRAIQLFGKEVPEKTEQLLKDIQAKKLTQ